MTNPVFVGANLPTITEILHGPASEGVAEMLAARNAEKRLAAIRRLGDKWILADKCAVTRREVKR